MKITTPVNLPYDGRILEARFIGWKPAKVYLVDIRGRPNPEKTEWGTSGRDVNKFLERLEEALKVIGNNNIPHIAIAFPHVTTVYRWGNPSVAAERETNLYLAGRTATQTLEERAVFGPPAAGELGCPVELHLANEELRLWMASQTVKDYLSRFAQIGMYGQPVKVLNPNKLREALEAQP